MGNVALSLTKSITLVHSSNGTSKTSVSEFIIKQQLELQRSRLSFRLVVKIY